MSTENRSASTIVPRRSRPARELQPIASKVARAKKPVRKAPKAAPRRQVQRPPHDPFRLGLPVGRLVPGAEDPAEVAFLVAAALLLAAAAGGSLVIGSATRSIARRA